MKTKLDISGFFRKAIQVLSLVLFFVPFLFSFNVFAQISAGPDVTICAPSAAVLTATPVGGIPGTNLTLSDDVHSGVINLGFSFTYFGNTYTQCVVSSNNYITFNLAMANAYSPWSISAAIPSSSNPTNAIMCPWQDILPSSGGTICYATIGTAPNRIFVVSFCSVPMFSCTSSLFTSQIHLYEGSNIIETHIRTKPLCTSWNGGAAIHGLQNSTGTIASVVPGRNYPTQWTAANDGYRFTPSGPSAYTISSIPFNPTNLVSPGGVTVMWYKGGTLIGTGLTISVSPTTTSNYTAQAIYQCTGQSFSDNVLVTVINPAVTATASLSQICTGQSTTLSSGGANTYSWSPAIGLSATTGASVTASPTSTTTYTVTGTDANGCTANASITITVNPLPNVVVTPASSVICEGNNVDLTASGANTYSWSPSIGLSATTGTSVNASPISSNTYTITGTDVNGCVNSTTASLTVNPNPLLSITPSSPSICIGSSVTISASGATTYLWSPATGLSSTSGAAIDASPTVTTTYNISGDNLGCISYGTVTVTVNSNPIVSVTPSNPVICFGGSTILTASGASTYSWSPSTGLSSTTGTSVTANPTSNTLYTVTGTDMNGCTSTATVNVLVNPLPTITVNPSSPAICQGSSVNLTAVGAASFLWSPASGLSATTGATVNATPTTTTTYTVTGTSVNSCINNTTVTVTVNANPIVSVNPAVPTICPGNSIALTANGASTYSWSPASGLSSTTGATVNANPPSTSFYTITGTSIEGCTGTHTFTMFVNSSVSATINLTAASCNGSNDGIANAVPTSGSGPFTYLWSNGQTTNPATGIPSGNISVSITDAMGCSGNSSATLTQPTALTSTVTPFAYQGGANVSCPGENDGSADLSPTGGTSPYTFLWSNGQTTENLNNAIAGNYSVTITDANHCTATNTVTLAESPLMSVSLISPLLSNGFNISCAGYNDGTVNSNVSNGVAPYSYLWSCGATTQSLTNGIAGNHSLIVTDVNGCTATNSTLLTEPTAVTGTISSFINVSCNGGNDGTASVAATGGTPPYNYLWETGQTSVTVSNFIAGIHTVTITDAAGCQADVSITITQPTSLSASVTGSDIICIGQSTQISSIPSGGTPPYAFNWIPTPADISLNPANQNPTVSPVVTTTYGLTITDANGCTMTADAVSVPVNPPLSLVVSPNGPTDVCPGESTLVNCTPSGGNGSYSWLINSYPGNYSMPYSATPLSTGYYVFTLNDNCGTPSISDSILITVNPLPLISFNTDTHSGCQPLLVNFTDNTVPLPAAYLWDFGDNNSSTSPLPNHIYENAGFYNVSLTATTDEGCVDSLSIHNLIHVFPLPTADFLFTPPTINVLDALVTFNDQSSGANSWAWDFGDDSTSIIVNPQHFYHDTGTFTIWLTVTSPYGCKDSIQNEVKVTPDFMIYVPSAFTPNGNGLNDNFQILGEGIQNEGFEFRVFTRWGDQVFSTFDPKGKWYGDYNGNGKLVESGVYVYTVLLKNIHNKILAYKGQVTLLR